MKRNIKVFTSMLLTMSLLLSVASCTSGDVKTAGKDIMDNIFEGHYKKAEKSFDDDDDDYDDQCEIYESFFTYFEDGLDFLEDCDVEYSKEQVDIKKDKATVSYVFEIEDEEYNFELNLKNNGKKWIVDDNAEFIVDVFELVLEVGEEEGDVDFKDSLANLESMFAVKGASKVAKAFYGDFHRIDASYVEPSESYYEVNVSEETEPVETTVYDEEYWDDSEAYMTMFIAMPGNELSYENEIQEIIAEKTGVRVKETWLTGQTQYEAIGSMIAAGILPDFIDGGEAMCMLYDAGVLVPWDDYLEKYPDLKELYTPEEWDLFRQDDGHIYWANVFGSVNGKDRKTIHDDQAFWIQVRVLEWAGYPNIETLDQYFDLLKDYADANPTMDDGTPVIPYYALTEDWRYFCLENAPMYLDGYPNNGAVIVDDSDPANPKVVDYNVTETAKTYFKKLNEMYQAGYMSPDFAIDSYDDYIVKVCSGAVLGMCDQYWDFAYTIDMYFEQNGLRDLGCDYVPLGLVLEEGQSQQWHVYKKNINYLSGIGVTTSCENPDLAFQFLNDLLNQDIMDLRFWGIEGVDYLIDENGLYYRTDEMVANWSDEGYKKDHCCPYSYMIQYSGTSKDGINAVYPNEQASEFFKRCSEPVVRCFEAYGVNNYVEMVGSDQNADPGKWYPMYSYINNMTTDTPGGVAFKKIGECKHEWLPKVIIGKDFESEWAKYMDAYKKCNPQDFLDEVQEELDYRVQH